METSSILSLYLHLDGPRPGNSTDELLIKECEQAFLELCECVKPRYFEIKIQPQNLGCMRGMQSAISWFFSQVPSGLIIEDDVVIHPNSIYATEVLLERYKSDTNIGSINLFAKKSLTPASILIWTNRHWPHIWGWATWSDRWQKYEFTVKTIEKRKDQLKLLIKIGIRNFKRAQRTFLKHSDAKNTWDTQWLYTHLKNGWRVASPSRTLSTNIGFDDRSTHVRPAPSWVRNLDDKQQRQRMVFFNRIFDPF